MFLYQNYFHLSLKPLWTRSTERASNHSTPPEAKASSGALAPGRTSPQEVYRRLGPRQSCVDCSTRACGPFSLLCARIGARIGANAWQRKCDTCSWSTVFCILISFWPLNKRSRKDLSISYCLLEGERRLMQSAARARFVTERRSPWWADGVTLKVDTCAANHLYAILTSCFVWQMTPLYLVNRAPRLVRAAHARRSPLGGCSAQQLSR